MKLGEWDTLGRTRGLLQRQLGELGAAEYAAHVTVNEENGRLRVLVATDIGLLDYNYRPSGSDPHGPWSLTGQLNRWASVKGLRLQTEAQFADVTGEARWIWRVIAEDPKIELSADSTGVGEFSPAALLPFARACIQHAG
jgi:hypothetical protein